MEIILEMSSYIFKIKIQKKNFGNVCDMSIMLIFGISISCVKKIINLTALNINKGSDWKKSFNKNLNIRGEKTINSILTSSVCVKYDVT